MASMVGDDDEEVAAAPPKNCRYEMPPLNAGIGRVGVEAAANTLLLAALLIVVMVGCSAVGMSGQEPFAFLLSRLFTVFIYAKIYDDAVPHTMARWRGRGMDHARTGIDIYWCMICTSSSVHWTV